MKTLCIAMLPALLAGCPDDGTNPKKLWLAPDMAETRVKLVDSEPTPF